MDSVAIHSSMLTTASLAGFDSSCLDRLLERCPNIQELGLSEIQKLDDTALGLLHSFKNLTYLDISHAGTRETLTDDGVTQLLVAVGQNLRTLILDHNESLTDRTLIEGVKPNCKQLRRLSLSTIELLTPSGLKDLFTDWDSTPLTHLNLHRCRDMGGEDEPEESAPKYLEFIQALVAHSGHSLTFLDLNSVDMINEEALKTLVDGLSSTEMKELDLSSVRAMDDFMVKEILDKLEGLKLLYVYGCNRVTDACPQKVGLDSFFCSLRRRNHF